MYFVGIRSLSSKAALDMCGVHLRGSHVFLCKCLLRSCVFVKIVYADLLKFFFTMPVLYAVYSPCT